MSSKGAMTPLSNAPLTSLPSKPTRPSLSSCFCANSYSSSSLAADISSSEHSSSQSSPSPPPLPLPLPLPSLSLSSASHIPKLLGGTMATTRTSRRTDTLPQLLASHFLLMMQLVALPLLYATFPRVADGAITIPALPINLSGDLGGGEVVKRGVGATSSLSLPSQPALFGTPIPQSFDFARLQAVRADPYLCGGIELYRYLARGAGAGADADADAGQEEEEEAEGHPWVEEDTTVRFGERDARVFEFRARTEAGGGTSHGSEKEEDEEDSQNDGEGIGRASSSSLREVSSAPNEEVTAEAAAVTSEGRSAGGPSDRDRRSLGNWERSDDDDDDDDDDEEKEGRKDGQLDELPIAPVRWQQQQQQQQQQRGEVRRRRPFSVVVPPNDGLPVALLAKRGQCSFEDKARVAQYLSRLSAMATGGSSGGAGAVRGGGGGGDGGSGIRNNVIDDADVDDDEGHGPVRYVVVYDDVERAALVPMSATDDSGIYVSLLFVSHDSGIALTEYISEAATRSTDAEDDANSDADAAGPIVIIDSHRPNSQQYHHDETQEYMLASLAGFFLVMACFGCFLVCAQSGLIHIEHNVIYIGPPRPTTHPSREESDDSSAVPLLTEEQVMSLPEIEYKSIVPKKGSGTDPPGADGGDGGMGVIPEDSGIRKRRRRRRRKHRQESRHEEGRSSSQHSESSNSNGDEDGPHAVGDDPASVSSSSSSSSSSPSPLFSPLPPSLLGSTLAIHCNAACSICLEEFAEKEKLRVLPCGHVFHTCCILPWLTERASCCPLCKGDVDADGVAAVAAGRDGHGTLPGAREGGGRSGGSGSARDASGSSGGDVERGERGLGGGIGGAIGGAGGGRSGDGNGSGRSWEASLRSMMSVSPISSSSPPSMPLERRSIFSRLVGSRGVDGSGGEGDSTVEGRRRVMGETGNGNGNTNENGGGNGLRTPLLRDQRSPPPVSRRSNGGNSRTFSTVAVRGGGGEVQGGVRSDGLSEDR